MQIFNLADTGQCSEYISCGEHGIPHFGGAVQCLAEESFRRGDITAGTQPEINGPAFPVNGPVKIGPDAAVGLYLMGSASFSVEAVLKRHHTRPKKFDVGATVHSAFQHLEAADLPFHLAIAPGFSDCVSNGMDILLQAAGEALHAEDAAVANLVHPDIELLEVTAAHDAAKPHRKTAHRYEIRRDRLQSCHLQRLAQRQ